MRRFVLAAAVMLAPVAAANAQQAGPSAYELLQTFSSVLNQVRANYVDSVTTTQLVHGAIDGMLRSLDPHSRFVTRRELEAETRWDAGELAGAGLVLDDVDGEPTVVSVYRGSAAERAGVQPGDRLRSVNDTSVSGMPASRLRSRLLGEKGTKARIGLARGPRLEPDTFSLSLKFTALEPHAVTDIRMLDATTGYLRFQQFFANAGDDVEKALNQLKHDGARRVILDLRGNPGGFVVGAVEIGGSLLPKGTLVFSSRGRHVSDSADFRTRRDGKFASIPLVVLIDDGTASAAEALAASLQDHDRAVLVGRRSFGKALIQRFIEIPPNGDGAWLTVAHVVTPSGRVIQRKYKGLDAGQYYTLRAGDAEDTLTVFHTDHGRPVRGGGGVEPDIELPEGPLAPAWWSLAADSSFDVAVADSVAAGLGSDDASRAAWVADTMAWRTRLLAPYLARVKDRLRIQARLTPALESAIATRLAGRAAEVRWGVDARDALLVRNDADVRAAMEAFGRLTAILGP